MKTEEIELFNLKLACGSLLAICFCFAICIILMRKQIAKLKEDILSLNSSLKKEKQESASWEYAAKKLKDPDSNKHILIFEEKIMNNKADFDFSSVK